MEAMEYIEKRDLRSKASKQLLWVGIASIVMFFGALTSYYIVAHGGKTWMNISLPTMFYVSTGIILMSSASMNWAMMAIRKNDRKTAGTALIVTFLLGVLFTFFQVKGWAQLYEAGVVFMGKMSHPAGSTLYFITLMHMLHLGGGLIALLVTYFKTARKRYDAENYLGMQLCAIYWHFLDALWVYLFLFLYFMR